MQAIETHYKGYRFRSRLEARWAVFWDSLGVRWEYEPEGFRFKDGTCYLPDFWLPEVQYFGCVLISGIWVEVKPEGGDFSKARMLCEESQKPVLFCEGPPDDQRKYKVADWEKARDGLGDVYDGKGELLF